MHRMPIMQCTPYCVARKLGGLTILFHLHAILLKYYAQALTYTCVGIVTKPPNLNSANIVIHVHVHSILEAKLSKMLH